MNADDLKCLNCMITSFDTQCETDLYEKNGMIRFNNILKFILFASFIMIQINIIKFIFSI
jgi:hypothetical protein